MTTIEVPNKSCKELKKLNISGEDIKEIYDKLFDDYQEYSLIN